MQKIKRIPYGKSDFEAINAQNDYYIDKTIFIPELEKTPFVFLIRPRRFGKSLFLSTLQSYYDINKKDRFEEFYRDTWILENPTEDRAKYMIMYFNFSVVSKHKYKVQQNFNDYCIDIINEFLIEYKNYIPGRVIKICNKKILAHEKLQYLATGLKQNPTKIYILIDEYDNFTNTLLSEYGVEEYNKIAKKEGYFKEFFTVLKALTTGSGAGLAKMFITGVSPITMDDVTSGMNIGNNISIDSAYNEIMGFTEKDVSEIIDYYTSVGVFHLDKQKSMETMKKWYDGYKFSESADSTMYNTDMVLYYMNKAYNKKHCPRNLIDDNCKTDYNKFRHFTTINNISSAKLNNNSDIESDETSKVELNGNFSAMERIITDGYIDEQLITAFPYEEITEPNNFVSLLFYFGLITIDKIVMDKTRFIIPNETVKSFLNDFIRRGYVDAAKVKEETHILVDQLSQMMFYGEWKESIDLISRKIETGMCARDKIEGERYIQAYLKSLLNLSNAMIVSSEKPTKDGYADLAIAPFIAQYPDIKYAYLIEIKYLKAKDKYNKSVLNEILKKAKKQIAKYATDNNIHKEWQIKPNGDVTLKKLVLIFQGRKLKYSEEI